MENCKFCLYQKICNIITEIASKEEEQYKYSSDFFAIQRIIWDIAVSIRKKICENRSKEQDAQ